ncbi:NAD(P)H-dependent flavin oxidoreductase [Dyella nitratireducens]|uniref:Propionate 3-nitronate monooxygenase n=1 Tax=Dyella nitratireducens TaxID=1849580 RepID=A0ABQ1FMD7_9GAMM|nr:nitronate monooxygenase [Dyella nitratireducens]GGA20165.1 2-nitropropane dioxygenase [Dyella nitratireducens]GLQ44414.1 2-nitropropane dioxygenase [Dyella nitratireducens]
MATLPSSPLLDRIGMRLPIIQAPMAGVSSPAMAAAVSNNGGLGSLGVGAMNAAQAREAIHQFRTLSQGPLNVNVFVHRPAQANTQKEAAWLKRLRSEFDRTKAQPPENLREIYTSFLVDDEMLAMLVEEKPKVVSFHFGLPRPDQIAALHQAGIVLLASATNAQEAKALEAAGVDAMVAQGYEAGGHRGVFDPDVDDSRMGTFALTRVLVRTLGIPVIAAGGIMDGAGIAAVLKLGAVAAQLGTAFVATDESLADKGFRALLFSDAAHHTVMTRVISGRPARSLANDFTRWGADVPDDVVPDYPVTYDAGKALNAAGKAAGLSGYGAQWAGQGAPLARALSTGALMKALESEVEQALG